MSNLYQPENFFKYSDIYIDRHICAGTDYHSHQFIEIAYIAHGEGIHRIGDTDFSCMTGDVFIINYDVPHKFIAPKGAPMEIFNCIFRPDYIKSSFQEQRRIFNISNRFLLSVFAGEIPLSNPKISFDNSIYPTIHALYKKMLAEYSSREEGWSDMLRANLVELIVYILRAAENVKESSRSAGLHNKFIEKVTDFIHQNLKEELSVSELSLICLLSPSHFSRIFKEHTGKSIKEYIQNARIEKACYLLKTTNLKISAVSEEVGYLDSKHFGTLFKILTGVTPSTYRKNNQI